MDHDARRRARPRANTKNDNTESAQLDTPEVRVAIEFHARRLERRFGLSEPDRDDVQQELLVAVWRSMQKFDPSRASHATYRERVLMWECQTIARKILARRRRDAHIAEAVRAIARRGNSAKSTVERDLALRAAMASLNERERQVCHGLMAGESISAIARLLGVHRATVHRGAVEVRRQFADAGFEDFAS